MIFGRLLGSYTICTFLGLLPFDRILLGAKFTLGPSLAFSYIGSVTAQHSSSGRQPNFAAWYKELNYGTFADSATIFDRRPSRWASAQILVGIVVRDGMETALDRYTFYRTYFLLKITSSDFRRYCGDIDKV